MAPPVGSCVLRSLDENEQRSKEAIAAWHDRAGVALADNRKAFGAGADTTVADVDGELVRKEAVVVADRSPRPTKSRFFPEDLKCVASPAARRGVAEGALRGTGAHKGFF